MYGGHGAIRKTGDVYHWPYHLSTSGILPTWVWLAHSYDLINWTKDAATSVPFSGATIGGVNIGIGGIDQTADGWLIEIDGVTYLFYDAMNNSLPAGRICVSIYNGTMNQLFDVTESPTDSPTISPTPSRSPTISCTFTISPTITSTSTQTSGCVVTGVQTPGPTSMAVWNICMLKAVTLATPQKLSSVSVYITQKAGSLMAGIYDNNGTYPHLIGTSATQSGVVGWNNVTLVTRMLPAGSYLIAVEASNTLRVASSWPGKDLYFGTQWGMFKSIITPYNLYRNYSIKANFCNY
jgi:hypothetical protein